MSRGLTQTYDEVVARLRVKHPERFEHTVPINGRRYPTMPAGDLTAGGRVCSPEGQLYTVVRYENRVLVVRGPNGAEYRWRRKPTTRVPVTWETRNAS